MDYKRASRCADWMMDNESKQEILREISAIRALLTSLQPVSDGGQKGNNNINMHATDTGAGGKRVMILF
jgi:hypothetical protein